MKAFSIAAVSSILCLVVEARSENIILPPTFHEGDVTIETLSVPGNLDGSKMLTAANLTSYDYWWFDAVSTSDNTALNVVFYNAGDIGNSQPLAMEISGVFANGSRFFSQALAPYGAVVRNGPHGVSGHWHGTGAAFWGTNLGQQDVEYGRAPAHYPCHPNIPGVDEQHLPRFFWANAVPDADAVVKLSINGTDVNFKGIGYHDKNWGDRTILKSPKFWDWGHTRLGPYSLVWYDLLDYNNNEYHRSYIAKDNEILVLRCDSSAVTTRPWGINATWPPAGGLNSVDGVVSRFALDDGRIFVVNITKEYITYDKLVYTRAVGSATGGIEGSDETFSGKAFFDEFTYGLLFG